MTMKDISFKILIDIIKYGYYSTPIINYIYKNNTEDDLKYYILLLKSKWKKDFKSAIFYANKVIATTTTTILRELARFELISLYVKNKEFEPAKKQCECLRNNFKNISEYARNLMIPGLKLLNTKYNILNKDFKAYSDNYEENNVDKAILKYSQAREYIKNEEYNKAYELFIDGYFLAKDFPHPTMMCNGLNGAAWWIRKVDKKKALIAADLLEYYIGYYFEDLNYIYNWFDTIFEVRRINKDIKIFECCDVVNAIYHNNSEISIDLKFMKFLFSPVTYYKIDNSLFQYMKNVLNLNDIKKYMTIQSVTLNKLIRKYHLIFSSNQPYEINNEIFKRQIKNLFEKNKEVFLKKTIDLSVLFLATYISYINKPKYSKLPLLKLIFKDDKNKIIKFFSANYEKMYFFNVMMENFHEKILIDNLLNKNNNPQTAEGCLFYLARKKLITELFKKPKNFKEFVFNYFKLSDEEMKVFDVFLRNCVRYDIKWSITPYPKSKIRDFAIKYGLGQKRIALGYYSFEDDERILIDEIIDKFL
ncbi:hypothetical protein Marpi_0215 [Marinitoga piezophila KA3]|uniref:Uncharacterized protein n=2 Tax=Marinitoga TaxID=160798 RepID=H2J3M3_MARPK|nr:hypothetical protein Marpi_0215 [Marinitoga piezophila KA3]